LCLVSIIKGIRKVLHCDRTRETITTSTNTTEVKKMLNQVERIIKSDAPIQVVAGQAYKGQSPQFAPIYDKLGNVIGFNKIAKGVPFVKVKSANDTSRS
jgi:hypothetical protein